ncbi:SEF2, partial [[Candida] subhashii]
MIMSLHSKNRLRLIIPSTTTTSSSNGNDKDKPITKVLKSCVRCRQHKTKCDALITNPLPCSHCAKKNINCTLDVITKHPNRININKHIDLIEKLTNEVEDLTYVLDKLIDRKTNMIQLLLERGKAMQQIVPPPREPSPKLIKKQVKAIPQVSTIQSVIQSPEDIPSPEILLSPFDQQHPSTSNKDSSKFILSCNKSIKPIILTHKQIHRLITNYESNFNKYLPIFPEEFFTSLDLVQFHQENELLFWCIIMTSCLNNPPIPNNKPYEIYQTLAEHIKTLVVHKLWLTTPRSLYVICALLILTTWPIPNHNSKIADNLSVKFISTMKTLSLQFGLHKLEFIDEFSHKTKLNISNEVNLNDLIRERIYKFININSNYWLINLGLANNNYNGFTTQDYIINKSSNLDILNPEIGEFDHYINSMLKISMIQSKLNENMNQLIGDTNESILLLPNQLNTSKLINFNMFEIILNDVESMLLWHDQVYLSDLIRISIEYSKLQLFVYCLSQSDISLIEYKKYI